ncbi:hypothetical protein ANCDUO_22335 [Ancylostoma duodenale]|uniref:Amino acid transporter transmembrane domain-containing protein n=1 Tax=Ancylostoma duodenale TaxID=51022 RepID=A0A0C2CCL1_9BILA|nr:hypothetical protein ANCDUO_22335 [Ancylostoma duodenale]
MPAGNDQSTQYSPTMGLLYIFNLIVGTGALALPKAFQTAGYALSILLQYHSFALLALMFKPALVSLARAARGDAAKDHVYCCRAIETDYMTTGKNV